MFSLTEVAPATLIPCFIVPLADNSVFVGGNISREQLLGTAALTGGK